MLAIAVAAQYNLEGITEMPLYPSLAAVTNDRSLVVDGDRGPVVGRRRVLHLLGAA